LKLIREYAIIHLGCFLVQIIIYLGGDSVIKKAIIISLAVVGGITLAATAIVGTVVAVRVAKDKKRLAKMSYEEWENENARRVALVDAFLETYCKKAVADAADADILSVEVF